MALKIAPTVHVLKTSKKRAEKRTTQTSHYQPIWPKYRSNMRPDSKYTGSMLRVIRAAHGVGRPPKWKMDWATPVILR